MKDRSKEMKRFMVYTVLGYDMNKPDEGKLKKACSERAYLDLSRVIPYLYSASDINEKTPKVKIFAEKKEEFKGEVEKKLLSIKSSSDPQKVIESIYKLANEENYGKILFKTDQEFTIGMAQKWVNMYLKYMWLLEADNITEDKLQMPIDSFIIDARGIGRHYRF